MRETNSDILGDTPLTRDRLRMLRLGFAYDTDDRWRGYNYLNGELTKGISGFGANDKGDNYLSRAAADTAFVKLTMDATRFQQLGMGWNMVGHVAGQWASAPLFSSEEFGLGGQEFGRAYDPSEFTGDHGLAASLELQYGDMPQFHGVGFTPYLYYDIGKVWNRDVAQHDISVTSAGLGLYFSHDSGVNGSLGLAWPLTAKPALPLYGGENDPRINLQMKYNF